ncbi:OmpA family protein [Aneurinibacillus aneurinilyticus]|jgi:outer membrane protein OmpA-like peptidoglycan-associated protein|uniref:OmpA family protein n=1 Tax=Aneurinibacillus aneurinilyticus TaxID=1391 RepID=UPI0023F75561|nr:OmpA family protein [Aneurinibacillus aneurinilyticus]MED0707236.1 OmpA family protein [Aneurinibacillus aneurinilyticus]MED0722027.1 OmpA family protein [Aneurinibacillus aneurinilyticus]MED0732536.1 OmpA family protein [Aneurinibacillus aneurinilyticus]MED0741437.1 OmpA family protein [Aneurinibacillus aneurinilyticus]
MCALIKRIATIMLVCSLAFSLSACTGEEKSTSAEQSEPITPGNPIEPGTPITPGKPIEPGTPITPGKPIEPGTPITPGKPIEPGTPISISINNPDVKVTPEKDGITLRLPNKLLFDYNSDTLRPEAEKLLAQIAGELKKIGKANVEIHGHTDSKGSEQYNLALSEKRAKAVEHYLATMTGLEGITLSTKGFGKTKPTAPNDTEEHREQNRRVEIIIRSSAP